MFTPFISFTPHNTFAPSLLKWGGGHIITHSRRGTATGLENCCIVIIHITV
jgi:hypothetical protein